MFKVKRPDTPPECTKQTGYNTKEIVYELERIFLGKCYLCEQNSLADPEIEHFEPHKKDENKKYDWKNLYYACSRCNSLKGATHINLLDCCDPNTDVFSPIMLLVPSRYDDEVTVKATGAEPCAKTLNTIELLNKCYNDNSTGLRAITRSVLLDRIHDEYQKILTYRRTILRVGFGEEEVNIAKIRIKAMLRDNYPFSVFWKWFVLGDSALLNAIPELRGLTNLNNLEQLTKP
ncbi:HNH endonuclease [Pseudomonas sp. S07E 245]|uniref:HNH endonuclease n=1 Tax=Pseudomonas sp. S07E 245 TaxID=2866278 RepID=UPI001C733E50|nr:HNH endonuclease [Pseudomonas sp. S07E 245]QYX54865.1 HNH endonuclease [Pseudomonas sp. S07E 245]